MNELLLDPRLFFPPDPGSCDYAAAESFWSALIDWASDDRAKFGEISHEVVCNEYSKYGYPNHRLDLQLPALAREYQSALGKILSRVVRHSKGRENRDFNPPLIASEDVSRALQFDVSATAEGDVKGLATSRDYWPVGTREIGCLPTPPDRLELCFVPGAELACEREQAAYEQFAGCRLHIVGGKIDQVILASLSSVTGLPTSSITWIECEKAKPPRNLAGRWSELREGRDITFCITGRVGHATSNSAEKAARKAGVLHLKVQHASELAAALQLLVK